MVRYSEVWVTFILYYLSLSQVSTMYKKTSGLLDIKLDKYVECAPHFEFAVTYL